MNRRKALVSTTAALAVGLGGWSLLTTGDRPSLPDGVSVETEYWQRCVLRETPVCDTEALRKTHNAILADPETARTRLEAGADAETFVEETDFSDSYVLLVQYRMRSARTLALDAIRRTEGGLRVSVATESPDGSQADDSVPHTLAVRVREEGRAAPRKLTVAVDGERTGTVSGPG